MLRVNYDNLNSINKLVIRLFYDDHEYYSFIACFGYVMVGTAE